MSLRALLIDDHEIFREGLKGLLKTYTSVDEITEARTLAEGLAAIAIRAPDIVTIDLDLPDAFGNSTVARLRAAAPSARHIVISATEDSSTILAALAAGAHGYVPKRLAGTEAAHAVREVLAGLAAAPDWTIPVHFQSLADCLRGSSTSHARSLPVRQPRSSLSISICLKVR